MHYISRVQEFNLRSLTGAVAVLSGAGVISIFKLLGTPATTAFWWYPIGLLVGAVVIASLAAKFD